MALGPNRRFVLIDQLLNHQSSPISVRLYEKAIAWIDCSRVFANPDGAGALSRICANRRSQAGSGGYLPVSGSRFSANGRAVQLGPVSRGQITLGGGQHHVLPAACAPCQQNLM